MEDKKLRTAAYCRVSTASDTQDGSFEVQCAYYEKLIKDDPNMEFVGVYGDHGKSGRSMRGRKELNRLISAAEDAGDRLKEFCARVDANTKEKD